MIAWGCLKRTGGTEHRLPDTLPLVDAETFVGRVTSIDTNKFQHNDQLALNLPYLSGTHFSVGRRQLDNTRPPFYYIVDHSRNGTFIIHGTGSGSALQELELVGEGQQEIRHGDRIVIVFHREIKVVYELDTTAQVAGSAGFPVGSGTAPLVPELAQLSLSDCL